MPSKPLKPCPKPGCGKLTAGGYCELHKRQYDQDRGSSSERGYGAEWRKTRLLQLANEPLCRECRKEDRDTGATEVDHIIPKEQGGTDEFSNLQSLCKHHHSLKTAKEGRWGR
jgi:5-methylcytosine-specific restriction protein A